MTSVQEILRPSRIKRMKNGKKGEVNEHRHSVLGPRYGSGARADAHALGLAREVARRIVRTGRPASAGPGADDVVLARNLVHPLARASAGPRTPFLRTGLLGWNHRRTFAFFKSCRQDRVVDERTVLGHFGPFPVGIRGVAKRSKSFWFWSGRSRGKSRAPRPSPRSSPDVATLSRQKNQYTQARYVHA